METNMNDKVVSNEDIIDLYFKKAKAQAKLEDGDGEYIGSFIQSTAMVICDPCYKRSYEPPLVNRIEVVAGLWDAYCYYFGGRVARLEAKLHGSTCASHETLTDDAGVDSGQFGFFDDTIFPYYDERDYEDKNKFYGRCCVLTMTKRLQAGIINDRGVVSSSGFGDGSYLVQVGKNVLGKVNLVSVEFISDEEF